MLVLAPKVLLSPLALALLVAVAKPALAEWRYTKDADPMGTGAQVTATTQSTNTLRFHSPYGGEQRARLVLRKHPRHGYDVMLGVPRGQFVCGVGGCRVLVRFDDQPAQPFDAAPPTDHSSNVLFIDGYEAFVRPLMKAKRVRIQATVYQEGSPVFEFNVAGFRSRDLVPLTAEQAAMPKSLTAAEQQERMRTCNRMAGNRKGEQRTSYMVTCLRDGPEAMEALAAAAEKARQMSSSVDRTADCIDQGSKQGLANDALTLFIRECTTDKDYQSALDAANAKCAGISTTSGYERPACEARVSRCDGRASGSTETFTACFAESP